MTIDQDTLKAHIEQLKGFMPQRVLDTDIAAIRALVAVASEPWFLAAYSDQLAAKAMAEEATRVAAEAVRVATEVEAARVLAVAAKQAAADEKDAAVKTTR